MPVSKEFLDGMAVLRACGHVSRQVYVELLMKMEWKYPDVGWGVQADNLRLFYAEQDKILTKKGDGLRYSDERQRAPRL